MYAVFAFIDDREFDDVCPNGEMMVHLFDTQQEAMDWSIELLIDKGDLMMNNGSYVLTSEWEADGRFCRHYADKEDVLIAWQESLPHHLDFFHLAQVNDHRELGG